MKIISSIFNKPSCKLTPKMRYSERIQECQDKIDQMAKKIYMPTISSPIHLKVSMDILSVPARFGQNISIPYLFLLKSSDIPQEFRINNLDDPRLQSDAFLQKAADWTYKFFGKQSKQPLTLVEKQTIKIFLHYIKDSQKSENAKEFVLAHEIGHAFHQHTHGILRQIFSLATLLKATGLILLFLLSIFLIPTPFSWVAVGILAILTTGFVISLLNSKNSKSCEKEADLVAAKFSERARQGGIYLFETLAEGQKRSRGQHIGLRLLFSADGNNRALYFTHPAETERVRYLKAYA